MVYKIDTEKQTTNDDLHIKGDKNMKIRFGTTFQDFQFSHH